MKKLICLLLALLMIFSLAACGGNGTQGDTKPPKDDDKPTQSTPSNTEDNKPTQPVQTKPNEVSLKIAGNIYVSYPSDWRTEDVYRGVVLYQSDAALVNVTHNKVSAFEGELEDIVTQLSDAFVEGSYGYSQGSIYGNAIEPTSIERGTVAGYDCIKFVGSIKTGDWNCHVYGYGLIVEDRVIMITGLVSAKAQDADMIAEIDALTDRIAASIEVKK